MLVEIGSTRGKFLYHRAGRSHDRITEYLRQRHKARKAKIKLSILVFLASWREKYPGLRCSIA